MTMFVEKFNDIYRNGLFDVGAVKMLPHKRKKIVIDLIIKDNHLRFIFKLMDIVKRRRIRPEYDEDFYSLICEEHNNLKRHGKIIKN